MKKRDILKEGIVIYQSEVKTLVLYKGLTWASSTDWYKAQFLNGEIVGKNAIKLN